MPGKPTQAAPLDWSPARASELEPEESAGALLFQRASVYLFANLANLALPFALLPFLVRELGPAEYGTVGLFASSLGIFTVLIGLGGVGYARTSYFKVGADAYPAVLGAVLLVFFASVALAGLALGGAAALGLFRAQPAGLAGPLLALGLLGGASQFVFTLRLALWQMAERPAAYGAALLSATALNLLLSIALVFGLGWGWQGRAWGIVLPPLVLGTLALLDLTLRGEVRLRGAAAMLRPVLRYNLPLVPHALAVAAIPLCQRSALAANAGLAEAGLFFVAFQLALPLRILGSSINLALKPWSYRRLARDDHGAMVRGSYASMGALGLAALAWGAAVWLGFDLVVGPELAGGRGVALWLIAAGLLSGCYLVVVKGLFFAERTRALMFVTVPPSLAYCVGVFWLSDALRVAQLGVLYQGTLLAAVWILSQRLHPLPWLGGAGSRGVR